MENRRHNAMRGISSGLKIVAWIVLIVGLLAAIAAAVAAQQGAEVAAQRGSMTGIVGARFSGVAAAALSAVMAVTWFLILYALGDGLILLLDIETNTRLGLERLGSAAVATRPTVAAPVEPVVTRPAPAGPPATAPG